MKKILFAIFFIFGFSAAVFAAPYLICDPYTTNEPTSFKITLNGVVYTTEYPTATTSDGKLILLDLSGKWEEGSNSASVTAVNNWGESTPVPFDFTAVVPSAPSGIGLSGN